MDMTETNRIFALNRAKDRITYLQSQIKSTVNMDAEEIKDMILDELFRELKVKARLKLSIMTPEEKKEEWDEMMSHVTFSEE